MPLAIINKYTTYQFNPIKWQVKSFKPKVNEIPSNPSNSFTFQTFLKEGIKGSGNHDLIFPEWIFKIKTAFLT